MLIPYEQLLIQTFHQNGNLNPEQNWRTKPTISVSYQLQPYVTTCPQPNLPHDPHKPVLKLATLEPYVTTYAQPINTYHMTRTNQS